MSLCVHLSSMYDLNIYLYIYLYSYLYSYLSTCTCSCDIEAVVMFGKRKVRLLAFLVFDDAFRVVCAQECVLW
jgi:hypothetical protein